MSLTDLSIALASTIWDVCLRLGEAQARLLGEGNGSGETAGAVVDLMGGRSRR